jgi:NADPH2:quinone reductase
MSLPRLQRAVQIAAPCAARALAVSRVAVPQPGPGQVLVRNRVAGLNFIDTYQRSGLYPVALPFTLGAEGAGELVGLGEGTQALFPRGRGSRVVYYSTGGAYAEYSCVKADNCVELPAGLTEVQGVCLMTQGLTADYLATDTFAVGAGHTVLVHAAGGGTGQLLVQIARLRGARVIGTASQAKRELGLQAGACEMLAYDKLSKDEMVARVRALTDGRGVDVVYDGVGKSTYELSLDCVKQRGLVVFFGNASGRVPPIDPLTLSAKGSIYITRPTLYHYLSGRAQFQARASRLFSWALEGRLKVALDRSFPLERAAEAHEYIEQGQTRGKVTISML